MELRRPLSLAVRLPPVSAEWGSASRPGPLPSKPRCSFSPLAVYCAEAWGVLPNDVAFRLETTLELQAEPHFRCYTANLKAFMGCYKVMCPKMPARVWCRLLVSKHMLYGYLTTHCEEIASGLSRMGICISDYHFSAESCPRAPMNQTTAQKNLLFHMRPSPPGWGPLDGKGAGAAATGAGHNRARAPVYPSPHPPPTPAPLPAAAVAVFHRREALPPPPPPRPPPAVPIAAKQPGSLRPSFIMLFIITCVLTPYLLSFFLPRLWAGVRLAMAGQRTAVLQHSRDTLARQENVCRGLPLLSRHFVMRPRGALAPTGPRNRLLLILRRKVERFCVIIGGIRFWRTLLCIWECLRLAGTRLVPRPQPAVPRVMGPLFSRWGRLFSAPPHADVEYRKLTDSIFMSGCERCACSPLLDTPSPSSLGVVPRTAEAGCSVGAGGGGGGGGGSGVCLRPLGSVHESQEYLTVSRLVTAYEAERRGLTSLFPPLVDPAPPPCVWNDSYAMTHTRTFLGGAQEAFAWLRPSPLASGLLSSSGATRNVFARMHAAQENVRRALWADVEQALARARARPPTPCGPQPPCLAHRPAPRLTPPAACTSSFCGYELPPPSLTPPSPPSAPMRRP